MGNVYVGNTATIEINCGQDMTDATGISLQVQTPYGQLKSWTPTVTTINGKPFWLVYTTVAGDLDEAGDYEIQPKFTLAGFTGSIDTVTLTVLPLFT